MNECERWKAVDGFDGYEVSNLGRVRSWKLPGRSKRRRDVPVMRKLVPDKDGYMTTILSRRGMKVSCAKVHVLVLEAFRGKRPRGKIARHAHDPNPSNNLVRNLAWGSLVQNEADKVRHGHHQRGERNPAAKLTDRQANAIRTSKQSLKTLALRYDVAMSTISRIRTGVRRAAA